MKAFIAANLPAILFAGMAVLGAVLHWAKKAYRGEVTTNPMDYWLADHPGSSAGSIGALVVAVWGVIFSSSLTGMQMHMIVASGFTLGWMLDSGINKASAPAAVSAPVNKQSGSAMVHMLIAVALAAGVAQLSGCGVTQGLTQPLHDEKVQPTESAVMRTARIAVDEANASLTALDKVIGQNAESGVWTRAQAQDYLDTSKEYGRKVDAARAALRSGLPVDAQSQAEVVKVLILTLHKRVAEAARKEK